jgi:integrase/recombinase XerC
MNGKLEKIIAADRKMEAKLKAHPGILREFYYDMKDEDKSYTTINNYIDHVIHFMRFVTNDKYRREFYKTVTSQDIKRYMNSIKRKEVNGEVIEVGDEIRAARWSSLNTFFTFLKNNNYITENPVETTRRPRAKVEHTVTYLTEEEIGILLNNVKEIATPMFLSRDLCIISIGLTTGLRVSAICNINVNDIDFNENRIKVIEKGNKTRYIRFGEKTKELIYTCVEDRGKYFANADTDALFVSRNGNRISTSMVGVLIAKYTEGITNKHITPHKLRASCATNLYQKTGDLLLTSKILGHENIQTTRRYAAVADSSVDKATQLLDDMV